MGHDAESSSIALPGVIAWGVGSAFFFVAFALRVSPSVMVEELMRDFGVTAVVLGNLSAFYFYAYAAVQIPVGVLMDRVGPRVLMAGAAMICALGCVIFAWSEVVQGAYIGRLLIGFGCAFSWVGVLTVIGQQLPDRHFAVFTGGGQFAGTAGAIAGQAPVGWVVEQSGWRSAMLFIAAVAAVLAVTIFLFVKNNPPRRTESNFLVGLKNAAGNPQTWIIAVIGMSLTGPVLAFAGLWGVPWFKAVYGIEKSEAATLLSLVFVGWLIGAPLVGWLSDRLRARKPLLLAGTLVSTLTIATVLYLPGLSSGVIALLLLVGGIGGSTMILTFAAAREHNAAYASGATLGIVNTFVVASGALFQPLIGFLLDRRWTGDMSGSLRIYDAETFSASMLVLPIFAFFGFLMALAMREPVIERSQ